MYTRADITAARALAVEAVRLAEHTGLPHIIINVRQRFAQVLLEAGEFELAEPVLLQYIDVPIEGARALIALARVRFGRSEYAAAAELLENQLANFANNRTQIEAVLTLTTLSWVRLEQGDIAAAHATAIRSLQLVREHLGRTTSFGHLPGPLEALSTVAAAAGQPALALRLGAASARLRETYAEPQMPSEHIRLERWLEPARRALGEEANAIWAAGLQLDADAGIDEAISMELTAPAERGPLTPREREVMQLVMQGLSNRQIGERLVITEGTARVHVERILGKLGLHSRSQLAAWAHQHEPLRDHPVFERPTAHARSTLRT